MIRATDFVLSIVGLVIGSPILIALYVFGLFDQGAPIFRQIRVGKEQRPFTLVKFRTMRVGAASVASHLADASAITSFGKFLRRTKLDEIPQLWNVLRGEMSLVGPRPCLFNQFELIAERSACGVFDVRPGITGLAQVSDIDMSEPALLAHTDAVMIRDLTYASYLRLILMTIAGRGFGDRVMSK